MSGQQGWVDYTESPRWLEHRLFAGGLMVRLTQLRDVRLNPSAEWRFECESLKAYGEFLADDLETAKLMAPKLVVAKLRDRARRAEVFLGEAAQT